MVLENTINIKQQMTIQFEENLKNRQTTRNIKYKAIDLFAGIGGIRLGFEQVFKENIEFVFSSEIDKYAQQTYAANFDEVPNGDITKIDEKNIPKHDIILAGFPCQAFSISGKKLGFEDTRGTLFFDVVRIAKYHKPKIIFLENVKNFEKHDNGNTLKVVTKTLNQIGYSVSYKVLNSADFSSPQKRERIYIIAFRNDLNIKKFEFPKQQTRVLLDKYLEKNSKINLDEFVIKRDDIILNTNKIKEANNKTFSKPFRLGIINKGGQGERIYSPNGLAITLSAYGGGAAAKTGAYLIDGVVRKLTPRECANIMGFPKTFKYHSSKSQSYKQFGNSVVVHVVSAIAKNIKKGLI